MATQHPEHAKGISSSAHFPSPVTAVPSTEVLAKLKALQDCEAACLNCGDRSVEEGMSCWRDCRSCAVICHATAALLSLNAPEAKDLLKVMASSCKSCAEICDEHATKHSSEHCRDCAEACRKCLEIVS